MLTYLLEFSITFWVWNNFFCISHSVEFKSSFRQVLYQKFMLNEWAGEWRMRARVVCVLFCCQNMQLSKFYIIISPQQFSEWVSLRSMRPWGTGSSASLFLHALNNTWAVIGRRKCQTHACNLQQRYARETVVDVSISFAPSLQHAHWHGCEISLSVGHFYSTAFSWMRWFYHWVCTRDTGCVGKA